MSSDPVQASFTLLRHTQPNEVEDRMFDIIDLNNEVEDDLLSSVDIPLKVANDPKTGRDYIKCDYNRDGDSYRSPFSNEFFPESPDSQVLTGRLRKLEEMAQKGFEIYKNQYFGGGTVSVYCWDLGDPAFGIGVFVKKDSESSLRDGSTIKGSISCSDVFEVEPAGKNKFSYRMVSSILISSELSTSVGGPLVVSGGKNAVKSETREAKDDFTHLVNVGQMIEDNSTVFMEAANECYVKKMEEILNKMKSNGSNDQRMSQQAMLAEAMKKRLGK